MLLTWNIAWKILWKIVRKLTEKKTTMASIGGTDLFLLSVNYRKTQVNRPIPFLILFRLYTQFTIFYTISVFPINVIFFTEAIPFFISEFYVQACRHN